MIYGVPLEGLNRALSLLIVTCPCALGIAVPLTIAISVSRAARQGIIIQNSDILDAISQIETIYLDKTGTLTEGQMDVLEVVHHGTEHELTHAITLALEAHSMHPIALALRRYYHPTPNPHTISLVNIVEIPGLGVTGEYQDNDCPLRRIK